MKRCPYCAEEIQDAAVVCRFCGRELWAAPAPAETPKPTWESEAAAWARSGDTTRATAIIRRETGATFEDARARAYAMRGESFVGARRKFGRLLLIIAPVTVLIMIVLALLFGRSTRPPLPSLRSRSLEVTASRNLRGVTVTNREEGRVRDCEVSVRDGDDRWRATTDLGLARLQSLTVPWPAFTAAGQTMPTAIGLNRDQFDVSCFVESEEARLSVGLSFGKP